MSRSFFPTRLETDRLLFERCCHDAVDVFDLHDFFTAEGWHDATEHMPWFRVDRVDEVAAFLDEVERQWADRERARYLLRSKPDDGDLVGTAAFTPEWASRRADSDVVLAPAYWGRGLGVEQASAFVELTFDVYDLDAYCTTCAVENERSRGMLATVIDEYGGEYEGRVRQFGSPRPNGAVPDQHRFSIVREEYDAATDHGNGVDVDLEW